ncbi:MAG: putative lipoprotein with Yx(FWY)xxD motif [Lentisphaeria bacterium]
MDQCDDTPEGAIVDSLGCPIAESFNEVSFANERLVGGNDSSQPGFTLYVFDNDLDLPGSSVCNDGCAVNWPPVLVDDSVASGVSGLNTITREDGSLHAAHNGRPLYFYVSDTATGDTEGKGSGDVWWTVPFGVLGDITKLHDETTDLEPDTQFETADALVTRFSDRPRTRHAREDAFQFYDHFIKLYFEDRSSNIEIIDYVTKGGNSIVMNVRTIVPLSDTEAENLWWYEGITTVAQYASNGIMTNMGFDGTYYNYQKTSTEKTRLVREIRLGDRIEFEVSQFSAPGIPRGQDSYYDTTFL